jgi:3-phosphoshikimate 1-carboxyvinyltransferase
MATVRVTPAPLQGTIQIPSSKSMGHRAIICAGLSAKPVIVDNITMSADIAATNACLKALHVQVEPVASQILGRQAFKYSRSGNLAVEQSLLDCGESGSTLRFFIPLGAMLGQVSFTGHGKLISRPLGPYYEIFKKQGLAFHTSEKGQLPLKIAGKLKAGVFELPGNVSSQFVSGLLFALPLLQGDSLIKVLPPVESVSYINLTLSALRSFGIIIEEQDKFVYSIKGGQTYQSPAERVYVEGDWSQAAFWLAAGAMQGNITCSGLDFASQQGDKSIVKIMQAMQASLKTGKNQDGQEAITAITSETQGTTIDAADCPDLVPILSALAAVSKGTTVINHAERLRLKECDRLLAMSTELLKLGAKIKETPDGLIIEGKPGGLTGGATVSAWNDHRVAMSLAIVASRCQKPVVITGSESVKKSYPEFWQDLASAGGKVETI